MDHYITLESEYIDDIQSHVTILEHIQTRAKVVIMPTQDRNKFFSIQFRTPVSNNKGIPHIIEHSVFCGSQKYPLKDPFVELMKGSMYTFLNAITYDESTLFPVASCQSQDFKNLMDVYLDAVFHPLLLEKKEIFLQEGWHYEYNDQHEFDYNGVVFNEMRGMETSPDFLLMNAIKKSLYPNTQYQYVAGGLSQSIVDLSYEEVIQYYQDHYHPSNCCIVLYGDMDMQERLDYLDKEYLSHFTRKHHSQIISQTQFLKPNEYDGYYPATDEITEHNGTYLAYNIKLCDHHDVKTFLMMEILDYVLMSSSSGLLKSKLIEANIGEDYDSILSTEVKQPFYSLISRHADSSQKESFKTIIQETLIELVNHGINQSILKAAIHNMEFLCKEQDYGSTPKGMIYAGYVYECLLFDEENPLNRLKIKSSLEEIKNEIDQGIFEQFIQDVMIHNHHYSCVRLLPSQSYIDEQEKALYTPLMDMMESIDEHAYQGLVDQINQFLLYQEEEDLPHIIKKIPVIYKHQIELEDIPMTSEETKIAGVKFLFQEYPTQGIGYLNLLFDLRYIKEDLLPYAGILVEVIGLLDTQLYSYQELNEKIDKETGGIFDTLQFYQNLHHNEFIVTFESRSRFLYDEIPLVMNLIKEILCHTNYHDTDRLYELLLELKSKYTNSLIQSGQQVAIEEIKKQYSQESLYQDYLSGITFYQMIKNIIENYERVKDELCQHLNEVAKTLFHKNHLIISYTGEKESLPQLYQSLSIFIQSLPAISNSQMYQLTLSNQPQSVGFSLPSQVQYIALGGKLSSKILDHRGHLLVFSHILNCDYLWQRVRVIGGAYGCQSQFQRDGTVVFSSYRDPQTLETLKAYYEIVDFLKTLTITDRQMRQYIIGTLNTMNMPSSYQTKGNLALFYYMCGITKEELINLRQQIINTKIEDIYALLPFIEEMLKDAICCVVAQEDKLSDFTNLSKIQPLL